MRARAAADDGPRVKSLTELRAAEAECTRCPLYKVATQVVHAAAQLFLRWLEELQVVG